MLTRLRVRGFKNLVDVDVRFGPFTCISGANGVGKSNLFDAIRFLSATANSSLLEAALRVRDESGRNTDVRSLFHRIGDDLAGQISFEAEMIAPQSAVDDLGQEAFAAITFLKYSLVVRQRINGAGGPAAIPLEIVEEKLVHVKKGEAARHLLFPHNPAEWRARVVQGHRFGAEFISTSESPDGSRIIKLHQDKGGGPPGDRANRGGGHAYGRAAGNLPRTVLSSATAAESPTALCARREMQSWRLLQLEPSALRQPDEFSAPTHLSSDGRHLAADLYRLASTADAERVYTQIANRLSGLIGNVKGVRIDRDEKRELLTVMLQLADGTELPARALSDGTLRFLALTVLELDPETPGVICLEEPENGIHPDRIPGMLRLLQDIAADARERADETNPLRQVIINTHSPSVVTAVPESSVLHARLTADIRAGRRYSKVVFAALPGSWRSRDDECPIVTKGEMLAYLNPQAVIRAARANEGGDTRLADHLEFEFK